jgi:hypothetical protein
MAFMMAMGLFCEDIREEKQGTDTLIGILPDNLFAPVVEETAQTRKPVFPKLALYVRINLSSDAPVDTLSIKLRLPDDRVINLTSFENELIEKSRLEASGSPFFGLVSKVVFGPMPIPVDGRFVAIVELNGSETVCGSLRVRQQGSEMQS